MKGFAATNSEVICFLFELKTEQSGLAVAWGHARTTTADNAVELYSSYCLSIDHEK